MRTSAALFLGQLLLLLAIAEAFVVRPLSEGRTTALFAAEEQTSKAAPLVSGEELEKMLTDWEHPLVVDAYATW